MLAACGGDSADEQPISGAAPAAPASGGQATGAVGTATAGSAARGAGKIINGKEEYLGKTPQRGGTMRLVYSVDPITWDPHATTSINTHLRTCMFNSPLLQYRFGPQYGDADVTPSPNLATRWEQVDETTVRFTIDPAATWTSRAPLNGRKLKSSDVAYSLNRIVKLPAPFASMYSLIDRMDTPDDGTLVMKLKEPYAPLFNYLGHYYSQIVAPEVVEQFGDLSKVESAKALGIGPFELDDWRRSTEMRFKRREGYFRQGQPYLDGVTMVNQPDANAALAAFRAGDLELNALTFDNKDSVLSSRKDLVVYQALSVVAWLVTFRSDAQPTGDERVRQAVARAIDRKGWLKALNFDQGEIDNGPIQALWSNWRLPPDKLGEGAKFYDYNPAEAKKLLQAAGVENLSVDFKFTNGYGQAQVADTELLKDLLSKVGITLNIDVQEYAAFVGSVMTSNPTYKQMSYVGVRFMGDPDEMLWDMFHPTGSKNFAKVNDPQLTPLLQKQRATLDPQARKQVVDDIQKYLAVKNYYVYAPAFSSLSAWQPWTANYRPQVSYDTGNQYREVWIDPSLKK